MLPHDHRKIHRRRHMHVWLLNETGLFTDSPDIGLDPIQPEKPEQLKDDTGSNSP